MALRRSGSRIAPSTGTVPRSFSSSARGIERRPGARASEARGDRERGSVAGARDAAGTARATATATLTAVAAAVERGGRDLGEQPRARAVGLVLLGVAPARARRARAVRRAVDRAGRRRRRRAAAAAERGRGGRLARAEHFGEERAAARHRGRAAEERVARAAHAARAARRAAGAAGAAARRGREVREPHAVRAPVVVRVLDLRERDGGPELHPRRPREQSGARALPTFWPGMLAPPAPSSSASHVSEPSGLSAAPPAWCP